MRQSHQICCLWPRKLLVMCVDSHFFLYLVENTILIGRFPTALSWVITKRAGMDASRPKSLWRGGRRRVWLVYFYLGRCHQIKRLEPISFMEQWLSIVENQENLCRCALEPSDDCCIISVSIEGYRLFHVVDPYVSSSDI